MIMMTMMINPNTINIKRDLFRKSVRITPPIKVGLFFSIYFSYVSMITDNILTIAPVFEESFPGIYPRLKQLYRIS